MALGNFSGWIQPTRATEPTVYLYALMVAAAGMVLLRHSLRKSISTAPSDDDAEAVEAQLDRLVARLQNINTNSESIDVREVSRVIDNELAIDINGCAAAREMLSRRWGLQPYADFLSRFVEGQRNIRLAREASAAGNAEDVWDNLGSAEACLLDAHRLFQRFHKETKHSLRN